VYGFFYEENVQIDIKAATVSNIDWILAVGCEKQSAARLPHRAVCQALVNIYRSVVANLAIGLFKDTSTFV